MSKNDIQGQLLTASRAAAALQGDAMAGVCHAVLAVLMCCTTAVAFAPSLGSLPHPAAAAAAAPWRRYVALRPAGALRMAEVEAGPVGRKERSKLKKAAKEQERAAKKMQQKQVDQILDELFDQIETEKRDLARYMGARLCSLPRSARSEQQCVPVSHSQCAG